MWKTFKNFFLEIFFPKICLGCGRHSDYICDDCIATLEISDRQYCPFCYPPLVVADGLSCSKHHCKLRGVFIACDYKNQIISRAIKLFKYEPYVREMRHTLGKILAYHLQNCDKRPHDFADFWLVPIPLHQKKLKVRGFNQTQALAEAFLEYFPMEYAPNLLNKIKDTPSQTSLSRQQRAQNIQGSFMVSPNYENHLKNAKILLLDDVFTTGSTMEECAKLLKQKGAQEVWGLSIARENLFSQN